MLISSSLLRLRRSVVSVGAAAALGLCLAAGSAMAAGGAGVPLDTFPVTKLNDKAALQNGAKLYMNYCLGCHGISQVRYNGLRQIGLSEDIIKQNLILTEAKFGDPIRTTMPLKASAEWFGKAPPDLSLTARSRSSGDGTGADWIYTYLRTYVPDEARPTGWNNKVYPNVGMPHVLWDLQKAKSPADYDSDVADLTAFLAWVAEPVASTRKQIGVVVLLFLGLFFVFAWRLNAAYWKDVR